MTQAPRPVTEIASWHAHVYFQSAEQRALAGWLRDEAAQRFLVRMGRWHDVPVGPHSCAMYQIAFECTVFADLVPWLALNSRGLSILVHPNTRNPRRDHIEDGLWIGEKLPVRAERLPSDVAEADGAGEPNTEPSLK
jgi:aromatic ring-cleaving dioxygenase